MSNHVRLAGNNPKEDRYKYVELNGLCIGEVFYSKECKVAAYHSKLVALPYIKRDVSGYKEAAKLLADAVTKELIGKAGYYDALSRRLGVKS